MTEKTCNECRFACFVDEGYSNYTVEGTTFYCGKKLHPDAPFDRWYGEDKKLAYAQQCAGFDAGEPITMDVEREDMANLSDEQKKILEEAES